MSQNPQDAVTCAAIRRDDAAKRLRESWRKQVEAFRPDEGRGNDWILTATGKRFWPLAPRAEDVCIEDIAHALSMKCRFCGHCREFYSVAQHSVLVSEYVAAMNYDVATQFAALLHDAAEAYLPDVVKPIKHRIGVMPGADNDDSWCSFDNLETKVFFEIAKALTIDLNAYLQPVIKEADIVMLMTESRDLIPHVAPDSKGESLPLWNTIHPLPPRPAMDLFLARYHRLKRLCGESRQKVKNIPFPDLSHGGHHMKAISLWEPWGTAIALLLKSLETRGWGTKYRGPLAIHCAKTQDHAGFIRDPEVKDYFQERGIFRTTQLSFGSIIAVCTLQDVMTTTDAIKRGQVSVRERAFGNYDEGRFAWDLGQVRRLVKPVPFKGSQGFFEVPDNLLTDLRRAGDVTLQTP